MSGPFDQGGAGPAGPFGQAPGQGPATVGQASISTPSNRPSSSPLTLTSGPKSLLFVALVVAVVGIVLALVPLLGPMTATSTSYIAIAVAAWALSGIATFILLGLYTIRDNALRANSVYVAEDVQTVLYRLALGLGGLGVIVTAFEIALWASKLS